MSLLRFNIGLEWEAHSVASGMDEKRGNSGLFCLEWKEELFVCGFLNHLLSVLEASFLWQQIENLGVTSKHWIGLPMDNKNKNESI